MKKTLLYFFAALVAIPAFAELPADGFYRVQNAYTKRYAFLLDNKGSKSIGSTSVDVGALQIFAASDAMYSDPSTVFYIKYANTGTYNYDICGQGTSVYSFLNQYLEIKETRKPYDGRDAYLIYGTDGPLTKYIGDVWSDLNATQGMSSSEAQSEDRYWYFNPISADSDQYFGVAPIVEADGKHYFPMYAGFPFSAHSEGLEFYTVKEVDPRGAAVIEELKGTVPSSTPVIIKCDYTDASANRLNIGGESQVASVGANFLKGVYFDNDSGRHENRTPFNKQTMRVLGTKGGRLAFVEADYDYLPRNQAYLQLTDPAQYGVKDFILMTEAQREVELGVSSISASSVVDVYAPDGRLVEAGISREDVSALGSGLYIIRSGSGSEKIVVR